MRLGKVSPVEQDPLVYADVEAPVPKHDEVLIRVDKCGVCRTDLHIVEGDLPVLFPQVIPGHEAVGRIVQVGKNVETLREGEIVGVPWLHSTCGRCEFCLTSRENLCTNKVFTGYSANGGYSQFLTGKEGFVFKLPKVDTAKAAPLLCAGIIGYRGLKVASPRPGGRIGFFGFGGSAHLTLQLASILGYETVAYSRTPSHLKLAQDLGASETILTGREASEHKEPMLDAALVFAPAGVVVLQALHELKKGGCVAIAAIHMSPIPSIDYDKYLFGERKIVSVEANTRADALEFLALADRLKLGSTVTIKNLREANEALTDLKKGNVVGTVVLDCSS